MKNSTELALCAVIRSVNFRHETLSVAGMLVSIAGRSAFHFWLRIATIGESFPRMTVFSPFKLSFNASSSRTYL